MTTNKLLKATYLIAKILGGFWLLVIMLELFGSRHVVATNFANPASEGVIYYYLPESRLTITAIIKVAVAYNGKILDTVHTKIIGQEYKIEKEIVADTRTLLSLEYNKDILSRDSIRFEVNANGLLNSLITRTEDRANAVGQKIITTTQPLSVNDIAKNQESVKSGYKEEDVRYEVKNFVKKFEIYPLRIEKGGRNMNWIILSDTLKLENGRIWPLDASFQVSLPVDVISDVKVTDQLQRLKETCNDKSEEGKLYGLVTRPLKNIRLDIKPSVQASHQDILSWIIEIPDPSRTLVIPVLRTKFGDRHNEIAFKNGMVTSYHIGKTSSFEGIMSIPIHIIKTIFTGGS